MGYKFPEGSILNDPAYWAKARAETRLACIQQAFEETHNAWDKTVCTCLLCPPNPNPRLYGHGPDHRDCLYCVEAAPHTREIHNQQIVLYRAQKQEPDFGPTTILRRAPQTVEYLDSFSIRHFGIDFRQFDLARPYFFRWFMDEFQFFEAYPANNRNRYTDQDWLTRQEGPYHEE